MIICDTSILYPLSVLTSSLPGGKDGKKYHSRRHVPKMGEIKKRCRSVAG
ncbi:hypothetical protein IF1G_01444 [Cordyceps javanica]|uniref:Uncharacterized protein n=1 Tax=Cordyceps javanica TaxID=43265 RepID=A0A545VC92_9HYPO|nr:hypothetical protein IF1G_01444 [Cordyceps javanica]